jgi:hypothetical protein
MSDDFVDSGDGKRVLFDFARQRCIMAERVGVETWHAASPLFENYIHLQNTNH